MLQTRMAVFEDAALIADHRKAMFADMGRSTEDVLETMRRNCVPWLERVIVEGKYFGWITYDGERPVASAGLMLLDWPPGPFDPVGEQRGYILNVYVDRGYRRRGLARELVMMCMAESRAARHPGDVAACLKGGQAAVREAGIQRDERDASPGSVRRPAALGANRVRSV